MNKRILSAAMALSLMAAQAPMMSYAQGASMTEEDLIAALEQAQAALEQACQAYLQELNLL